MKPRLNDREFLRESWQLANFADVPAVCDLQRRSERLLAVVAPLVENQELEQLRAALDAGDGIGIFQVLDPLVGKSRERADLAALVEQFARTFRRG